MSPHQKHFLLLCWIAARIAALALFCWIAPEFLYDAVRERTGSVALSVLAIVCMFALLVPIELVRRKWSERLYPKE